MKTNKVYLGVARLIFLGYITFNKWFQGSMNLHQGRLESINGLYSA